jgi:FKBP-type peptidyl-prolyl cis-trans isomerase SlyD
MKITDNTVVTVTYRLHANRAEEAQRHIETADEGSPLKFLYGVGMMIPGFEHGLEGKTVGESFSFSIAPEDAYGSNDTDAVVSLPIDIFKVDDVVDFNLLKVDNVLPMSDGQGHTMNGRIVSFDDTSVKMDFNHPLADHTLHFAGEILEVRVATPEELEHGHVH